MQTPHGVVHCRECGMCAHVSRWNTRPIEGELRAENERLVGVIAEHVAVRAEKQAEIETLRLEVEDGGFWGRTCSRLQTKLEKVRAALEHYSKMSHPIHADVDLGEIARQALKDTE